MPKTVGRFLMALAAGVLALAVLPAHADGLQALQTFIQSVQSGRADFVQTVTGPAREGQAPRVKTSSGSFEFLRPGKFRFDYRKPFEQAIVADGKTLWLYDADLNQATERQQAQVLGQTPAALVASASDLGALRADFELSAEPSQDGLQWVKAKPKARDGTLQQVRVGFDGTALAQLEILDSFGQRSLLKFSRVELNPELPASRFQFKAPAGADVLRQ